MWKGTQGEEARADLGEHKPGPNGGRGSGDQDWSAGGLCLNLGDWEGRRKAGSGYCEWLSPDIFRRAKGAMTDCFFFRRGTWCRCCDLGAGLSNILFFIDPTTGVAMMGGTQMFPVDDPIVEDVWVEAQKIVYAGLMEAGGK